MIDSLNYTEMDISMVHLASSQAIAEYLVRSGGFVYCDELYNDAEGSIIKLPKPLRVNMAKVDVLLEREGLVGTDVCVELTGKLYLLRWVELMAAVRKEQITFVSWGKEW